MFNSLSHTLRTLPTVAPPVLADGQPRRKALDRPVDAGLFVLPLKQSFIKDARIMPGAMRLLALLSGWAGTHNNPIETTQGVLAKHLSRSVRQVYRYLQDAMEEGYLLYRRTTNRMGLVTGVRVWLNLAALRKQKGDERKRCERRHRPKTRKTLARTLRSDTNGKQIYRDPGEQRFQEKLAAICKRNGIDLPGAEPLSAPTDRPRGFARRKVAAPGVLE